MKLRLTLIFRSKLLGLSILFSSCFFVQNLNAQNEVKGKVLDGATGEPLVGASIVIKGTTEGAQSDFDGAFSFKTDKKPPFFLQISFVGYEDLNVNVENLTTPISITLGGSNNIIDVVEVKGARISEKQKSAPLTIESLDKVAIKQTAAVSFYEGLGALKGVDLTTASLGFTVINTRGFNSTSPVRSLQIIDGVDNQSPGLNFSLGNFLGSSELDVQRVDLIQGASSAYYGPNAFNGVISMETKNPFYQKGLGVQLRGGSRSLFEGAIRYADAIKNKENNDFFAYKFNLFYLRADDWVANNTDAVDGTNAQSGNVGGWDKVNTYGDEYNSLLDYSGFQPWSSFAGLGEVHRTGYNETDVVNYNTRNIKANAAFHFRTRPALQHESPEFIISSSFGTGTTVYQGDNRFSLRGILFAQNRLEFRKKDKYFIRLYSTNEDAGRSYDPYFTALRLQSAVKTDDKWAQDYRAEWSRRGYVLKMQELGYPKLTFDPVTSQFTWDDKKAKDWLVQNQDSLRIWHQQVAGYANSATLSGKPFLAPGTPEFQAAFDSITSRKSTEGGTLFFDRSALYHAHGEYKFEPSWTDHVKVGSNFRLYAPYTQGTIFTDSTERIYNTEFGVYAGIEKKFLDKKLILSATARLDKNVNFPVLFSPAASVVYAPNNRNYLRFSFSSAIRNPTLADQYLNFNVGRATLLGNLNGYDSLITVKSFLEVLDSQLLRKRVFFNVAPIVPEQAQTFELGYRTTLFEKFFIDASYYYTFYKNFIGYKIGIEADFDEVGGTGLLQSATAYRVAANSQNPVSTQGFSIGGNYYFQKYFMLAGNYSWNCLNVNNKILNDEIIPAFNTPEHKYNISFSGRDIPLKKGGNVALGFNINYKWVDSFIFEGSPQFTGNIPSYDLLDAQVNANFAKQSLTIKLGASNLLNNKTFQVYGGPRIGTMAYLGLLYDFVKK
jgi:iron complex outermembrane recepter protein